MDYYVKSVIPVIESNYENFTALEKNIADFFMKNEEKMDFSAKEIAKHLFVSEASLSRFAKKCGFRGYREFIYQYEESFEEKNKERFTVLVNSVYKYTVLLSSLGGIVLYVCSEEILNLFYGKNSRDIVVSSVDLVKYFALTVVFYSLAGTAVFAVQAIGLAKKSILPYAVSGVIRIVLNIVLVTDEHFVLYGAVISGAVGYAVLTAWNIVIFCKYTKIKFDFLRVILLPLFVFGLTLYFCEIFFKQPFLHDSTISLIIIKGVISFVFYCILCFLCGMLNFKDFFCNYITKKIH